MTTGIVDRIPVAPLLRHDQVEEMAEERKALQEKLRNPHIQDKGQVRRHLTRLEKQLQSQDPHVHAPKNGEERDALAAEVRRLETEFTQGMLSATEMRRNPPTAVDRHRRWEAANKPRILRWKNALRMLDPDNTDRDLANIERLRRQDIPTGAWTNAQIPGHFVLSDKAKENYEGLDFSDHKTDTTATTVGEGRTLITPNAPAEPTHKCAHCGSACSPRLKYCNGRCRTKAQNQRLYAKRKNERLIRGAEAAG